MVKAEIDPIVTTSSGNVFADLGRANAEELKAKARLAFSLNTVLTKRKLTPLQIGKMLGISQAKVAALQGCRLDGFSLQRLMRFATALEHDVVIQIRPRAAKASKAQIMARGAA